jgi:hypothetical protein
MLDPQVKQALIEARSSIDSLEIAHAVREILLEDFGKLTEELGKREPDHSLIEYLLSGVERVAKAAEPVAKLGALIAKMFT